MADYFENVQWKVSFAELVPEMQYNLGDDLPVKCVNFFIEELRAALRCLAAGKASGIDDIPPDFWKVMLQNDGALAILLDLCRACHPSGAADCNGGFVFQKRRRGAAI